MARHVSCVAWTHTTYRIAPVSRLTTLKIGGRSFATVPWPRCLLARRRGESAGSAWRSLFSPGVLIAFICFKGGASQRFERGRLVYIVLHPLAQRMHRLTGATQFPRPPSGGFALGNATHQQDQGRRGLLRFGKGRARQDRIRAIAVAAAIGIEMCLRAKQSSIGAATMGQWSPLGCRCCPSHWVLAASSSTSVIGKSIVRSSWHAIGNRGSCRYGSTIARWFDMSLP